jgi:hypothetical protein
MRNCCHVGIFILAVTILLPVFFSKSSRAEDRTLSGILVTGTYDVYGEVQTDGYTVIENGVQVRLRSLEQTTFSPGFRVMAGGGLHVSSLSSSVPDEWKLRYFGTLEVDMEADPDGDGYTNLAELFMGTDPTIADNSLADTDGDGLADSWEMLHYGTLDYVGGDDPGGDGYTLADDYRDVLDYFYSNAVLYLSGEVAAGHYRAIEIHSRGWTSIGADNAVHLTKRDSVRLFADFSVARGATFTVSAAGTPSITAPAAPTNLRPFFPEESIGLSWDENTEFDIAGYLLYRDGSLLTTLLIDAVSFIDDTVQHGTTYTYQVSAVDLAGKESGLSAPLTLTADFVAPNLISGFPGQGELITSNGEPVSMLITFGDSGGGIASIRIFDENGNDITNRVLRVNNSIELMLFSPHSGEYRYRIVVTDHGGNTLTYELVFTVDATPLETIASPAGGDFGEPVSVTLTASKTATIYYSVDGYPPIVGSATFGPSPIEDIALSENTSLQFFAVDETGYQERTNNEIYRFTNPLIGVEGVSATAQSDPPRVELTWQPVTGLDNPAYQVFRCLGEIDCAILAAARQGRYPPPQRFALNASPRSSTTFTDSEVVQGATYRYAVLVADGQGTPGLLSELVSAQIAVTTEPADESEAINRAVAWLKQTQSPQGTWGASGPLTMLATSQALSGLQRAQSADAGMTDALFYLRGHLGNNTDYQARKILTLNRFGHNTDEAVNRLISYAVIDQDAISGWGLTHRYAPDALDTALGLMAVGLSENPPTATNSVELLSGESLTAAAGSGAYGWRSGGDTSIFVSGAVYNALQGQTGTPTFDRQWLFDLQRDDGSFNDSLTDTAAVLLWLEPPAAVRDSAAHYLISAQEENGSWGNDAYLTGLCLEALLVGDMP